MRQERVVLGVDIGGSSIKCCLLNSQEIVRHTTLQYEQGKDPDHVLEMVISILRSWNHGGPIGIGFPGLIVGNRIVDAPNLGREWEDYDLPNNLMLRFQNQVSIINDADAAALAMARETAGWEFENILCLTLGTGIGSAWLKQGNLDAGTEYGRMMHPDLNCSLEEWASVRTMNQENLSLKEWTTRLATVLDFLLEQFKPDRFILSGGITTSSSEWVELIQERITVPIVIS
ncbi:MAG: ROK family protein, partial [Candidatus Poseidoniaceae archaeon]